MPALLRAVLAAALYSLAFAAAAQQPLPACHSPEVMEHTRAHRFAEAVEVQKQQLARIDPKRTDIEAIARAICLKGSIGAHLSRLERMQEALAILVPVINEAREKLGADHAETLNAELLLAAAQGRVGQYEQEIRLLQDLRPRVARRYGPNSHELHNVLRNLATAYHWTRNWEDALPLDREALRIMQELAKTGKCGTPADCRASVARGESFVAESLRRLKRFDEALPLAEKSAAELAAVLGAAHPNTLEGRQVIASTLMGQGQRERALAIEKEVYDLAERHHGPEHPITRKSRGNYAVALEATGKRAEALALEETQLAVLRDKRGANHPETLLSLTNYAERLIAAGDIDRALPVFEQGLASMLATRAGLAFDDRLTLAWQSHWRRIVDGYVGALLARNRVADAFLVTEYFKARLLSDRLSLDPAERGLPEDQLAALRKVKRSLASVEQELALKRSMKQPTAREDIARAALLKRVADFKAGAAPTPVSLPSQKSVPDWYGTLNALEKDAARVSFTFLGGWVIAFVDRGGQIQMHRLARADAIVLAVERYRNAMRERKDDNTAHWLATLSDALVKPLAAELKGKARLMISPHNVLSYVPWDSLLLEGKRLGDAIEVSVIPSFALHAQLAQRKAAYARLQRRSFLGFGGAPYQRAQVLAPNIVHFKERLPVLRPMDVKVIAQEIRKDPTRIREAFFGLALGFPDLPASLEEVKTIARFLGNESFTLTDEYASEWSLNRLADDGELPHYRVVHFSAHGFVSDDEPGLSAVVLSQVNRQAGTDGYVTVAELAALDLRSDLVVISTCDSGVGKLQQGEGLLGMSYALFQAGTVASIVTLWPIGDKDSARLMVKYYELWKPGTSAAQALAITKRWALANGVSKHTVDAFVIFGL